jgi:hypothetical protein
MAGIKRVTDIGEEYAVKDIPHAMLWPFQSLALSAGMYGSQIWSFKHIKLLVAATGRNQVASTDIHVRHAGFVKRVLGVKRSVPHHIALKEAGQIPMHYYWRKSVIKFWNSLVNYCESNSGMMRQVNADLDMTRNGTDCWSNEVSDVLKLLYSLVVKHFGNEEPLSTLTQPLNTNRRYNHTHFIPLGSRNRFGRDRGEPAPPSPPFTLPCRADLEKMVSRHLSR